MKFNFVLIFFLILAPVPASGDGNRTDHKKLVVGYYPHYNRIFYSHKDLDFSSLTHICHAFVKPDSAGNLIYPTDFLYPELIEEAHNSGVKVLVSLGGWGGDAGFSYIASDSASRNNFAERLTSFCLENNYDGADVDWEYPGAADKKNFVELIKVVRHAFDRSGIEFLSAALPSKDFRNGYDIPDLSKYLNWFGIMTYDFHGSWSDHSGHNSPLYSSPLDTCGSIEGSTEYYLKKGIQAEKLLIGIPFYGRLFNTSVLYLKNRGGSSSLYPQSNYKVLEENWKYMWDEVCDVPVIYDPNNSQLISFEDLNSIRIKSRFIFDNSLGGAVIWALGQDYDGSFSPLLSALGKILLNPPADLPSSPIISSMIPDSNKVRLRWYPARDAWTYELEISGDSSFSSFIIQAKRIRSFSFLTQDLNGTKYFWRVRALNFLGPGNWSETGVINPEDRKQ